MTIGVQTLAQLETSLQFPTTSLAACERRCTLLSPQLIIEVQGLVKLYGNPENIRTRLALIQEKDSCISLSERSIMEERMEHCMSQRTPRSAAKWCLLDKTA
ncbi:uncharacterized protein LOC330097 [Mus musculus]|uniref:uncharacterized protein LOC330097 n=1 Tax=Mus musculus TaxID=10090 RepID=UPI00000E9BD7|nr:uncharacterized protein LOC330097 [Mus musculus]|eukprot:NP_001243113.1 uncharacterized protein LOC330097 [Mus musculus]